MSIQRYSHFMSGRVAKDDDGTWCLHKDHLAALAAKEADYMAAVKQRDEAWSTIEDMRAEVERLTAQRDEARATKDMHRARQQEEIERANSAEAEADRLRAEVDELRRGIDLMTKDHAEAMARVGHQRNEAHASMAACQARAERMARYIAAHFHHRVDCPAWGTGADDACTCGLADAIAAGAGP